MNRQCYVLPVLFLYACCCCLPNLTLSFTLDRRRRSVTPSPSNLDDQFELEIVKQRILAELGLTRIPDVSKANTSADEMERVLEAYHRAVKESELEEEAKEEEERREEDEHAVERVYSYKDSDSPLPESHHRLHIPDEPHFLYFPVDIVANHGNRTAGLTIQSAKLRVFRRRKRRKRGILDHRRHHHSGNTTVGGGSHEATVILYQLTEAPRGSRRGASKLLVEQRTVHLDSDAWEVFDISRTVSAWISDPSRNHGLQLECDGCEEANFTFVTRERHRRHNASQGVAYQLRTAMLDISILESSARTKRSGPLRREKTMKGRLECSQNLKRKLCCRHSLKVVFKEIGWDWVVEPAEFEAYYCKGKCPYRYTNYASTHALIQSILNHHRQRQVPRPCCAPKKLKPLTLVHYNDKVPPELVVTKQKGMIVKECACT